MIESINIFAKALLCSAALGAGFLLVLVVTIYILLLIRNIKAFNRISFSAHPSDYIEILVANDTLYYRKPSEYTTTDKTFLCRKVFGRYMKITKKFPVNYIGDLEKHLAQNKIKVYWWYIIFFPTFENSNGM